MCWFLGLCWLLLIPILPEVLCDWLSQSLDEFSGRDGVPHRQPTAQAILPNFLAYSIVLWPVACLNFMMSMLESAMMSSIASLANKWLTTLQYDANFPSWHVQVKPDREVCALRAASAAYPENLNWTHRWGFKNRVLVARNFECGEDAEDSNRARTSDQLWFQLYLQAPPHVFNWASCVAKVVLNLFGQTMATEVRGWSVIWGDLVDECYRLFRRVATSVASHIDGMTIAIALTLGSLVRRIVGYRTASFACRVLTLTGMGWATVMSTVRKALLTQLGLGQYFWWAIWQRWRALYRRLFVNNCRGGFFGIL